jgi:F-type H+-transporting ATPase subunit epsilon
MASTFKFELVSPERILLSEDVDQVVVPGTEGDFTVLPGHAPVIAALRPGVLDVQVGGKQRRVFVRSGFAEVDPESLTVLAQTALDLDSADKATIGAALTSAEAELADAKTDEGRRLALEAVSRLKQLA